MKAHYLGHVVFYVKDRTSRMRKKSASGVLASLRGSPYRTSTIRPFARCGLAGRPFCASCG
jgi:hypothetical protein